MFVHRMTFSVWIHEYQLARRILIKTISSAIMLLIIMYCKLDNYYYSVI